MDTLVEYLKEIATMANALKGGFVILLLFWAKKGVAKPCDKHSDMIDRIAKVEAKDDTNALYREISQKERDEIKSTLKHTDNHLNTFVEEFKVFKHDFMEHFQVKPQERTGILIFDDDIESTDLLKSKLSQISNKFQFFTTTDVKEPKHIIRYNTIKYIFADLLHHGEPLGLSLYADCRMYSKNIPFFLYSCAEKPNYYNGKFLSKNEMSVEKLKSTHK